MIVGENVMSREIINPESLLNSKKYVDLTLSTLESLVSTVSSFNNNIFSISGLVESAKSDLKKSYDNLINTSYNICKTIIDFEEMPSDMSFEDMLAYILNNCGDSSELGLEQILALGLGFDSVVDQLGIKTQVIEMLEGKMTYEEFCQKLASGDEEATIIFNTTLLTAISKNYQEVIDSLEYDTIIISEDEAKLYIDLYNGSQMASFDQGFIQKLEDGTYKITGLDFIAGYDGTDIRGLYDEYIRNNPDSKLTFEEVEKFIGDILDRNANNNSELRQQQAVLEDGCYSIKQQLKLLPYIYISNQEGFDKYANQDYSSNLNDVTVDVKDALKFLSRNVDINYLTQDEIATFCYLYNEQGKKAADAYITAMEDAINSREAKESVEQYFLTGDPSLLSAGLRGVMDGTESFFEGIGDFFDPDDVRSLNDYEMMYMMQFLAMNYDMKTVEEQYAKGELSRHDYDVIKAVMDIDEKYRDNVLSTSYNVGMSVGNMLPSIVLSFVTQGLGGTLGASANAVGAAAKVLSSGSMFLSVAGNSLEGAYQDKAYINPMQAYLYAIAMGGTAAGSEFLLGNTVFSKNFDTGLKAVGKEVVQELFENVLGGELGAIIGEDYSIDDFFAEAGDTAITTLFSTLILNGGTRGLKITSDIASGKINLYTIVNPETGKTSIDWKLYNDSYAHMMNGEYDKVLNLALDSGNTSLAQSMVTTLLNNNDNGYFGDFVDLAMKNNSPELLIPLLNQDGGKSFQSFYEQMDDAAERSKVDSLLKSLVDSYDGTEKVSSNTESIPSTPPEKLVEETLEKMNKALEAKKVPSKSLDDIASIPSTPPEELVEETLEKMNKALEAKKVPSKSLDDIASIPSTPPEELVEETLEKMVSILDTKKNGVPTSEEIPIVEEVQENDNTQKVDLDITDEIPIIEEIQDATTLSEQDFKFPSLAKLSTFLKNLFISNSKGNDLENINDYTGHNFFKKLSLISGKYGVDQNITRDLIMYRIHISERSNIVDYLNRAIEKMKSSKSTDFYVSWKNYINSLTNGKEITLEEKEQITSLLKDNYDDATVERILLDFEIRLKKSGMVVLEQLKSKGFSIDDSLKILSSINTTGICSYANVASILINFFSNTPQKIEEFKQNFGFSLFKTDSDNNIIGINDAQLIVDMYINMNKKFFVENNGKMSISPDFDTKRQIYLSRSKTGLVTEVINDYLSSKGILYTVKNDKNITSMLGTNDLENKIISAFRKNKVISLGQYNVANKPITFYSKNGDNFEIYTSTTAWNEGGSHITYVTGIEDGYLRVASWGKELYIKISDLKKGNFELFIASIGGNDI